MARLQPVEVPIRGKDQATKVMKRVGREAKSWGTRMRREARSVRRTWGEAKDALLSVDAAIAALSGYTLAQMARAFGDATMAIAEQAAELDNAARTAGITVEAYQELTRAAQLQDISSSAVTIGLKTVARTAEEFTRGVGEAKFVYEQLGVSVTDANGALLDTDTLLVRVGEALAGVEDESKRLAMAQKVLGESGGQLLPLFDDGGDKLRAYREELRQTGQVMTQEQITKFRDMKDALGEMGAEMGNVTREFVEPFVGDIEDGAEAMRAFLQEIRPSVNLLGEDMAGAFRSLVGEMKAFWDLIPTSEAAQGALMSTPFTAWLSPLIEMKQNLRDIRAEAAAMAAQEGEFDFGGFSPDPFAAEEAPTGGALGSLTEDQAAKRQEARLLELIAETEIQAEMTEVVAQAEVDRLKAVERALADEGMKRGKFNMDRIKMQRQANAAHLRMDQQLWGAAANLAAQGGGKLHAVAKAIQVGQAIMATKAAVAQALAIPPAPNLALAAKAKLLGGLQIAGILATSFGSSSGGGGGGALGGGGAFGGGGAGGGFAPPAASLPPPAAPSPVDPAPQQGGGVSVFVTVQGDAVTEGELAQKLQTIIEENAADGRSTIVVGR